MSKDTLFTNDTGAAGGSSQYVQDVLTDVTFPPSANTGLTSNTNTNPMSLGFSDDDLPRYSAKHLYIKDLLLISDRSKWISNKPTYKVITQDNFPSVNMYIFGEVNFQYNNNQPVIQLKNIGDGIAVNGIIQRAAVIVNCDTSATATAQVVVDGTNGNTIDFSSLATDSSTAIPTKFAAFVHKSTNETKDLHDIRFTALQANTLRVVGCIVYFENSGANIEQNPGTTYVNKTKATTTTGATLTVPTAGSSLGGVVSIYKTSLNGYTAAAYSAGTISSSASGASGTNLLTVTTGQGASFGAGYFLCMTQGSSIYLGQVASVSTDTLTMGNTLGFGTSTTASVYTMWKAGMTFAINASLFVLANTIDFASKGILNGVSVPITDPNGQWGFFGGNIGMTMLNGYPVAFFAGASGYMQVDGYFSAAEFETIGSAAFAATIGVNGTVAWSVNAGQTGIVKRTVFTDAGPGWNSFVIAAGASIGVGGVLGISKVNLYQRARNYGVSYGVLAQYDIPQTYISRGTLNATVMALGGVRRLYADQLYLKGPWTRGQTITAAGGVFYTGASTTSVMTAQYYGKDFAIIGTNNGGSLSVDGAFVANNMNAMQTVASEGWHTVQFTAASLSIVQAFDFVRPTAERFKYVANTYSTLGTIKARTRVGSEVKLSNPNGYGSVSTGVRRYANVIRYTGNAITYTDSSTRGALFTINEDGIYIANCSDQNGAASLIEPLILVNAPLSVLASPGGAYSSYINYQIGNACYATNSANGSAVSVAPVVLYAGDIVTVYEGNAQSNAAGSTNPNIFFSIVKVADLT